MTATRQPSDFAAEESSESSSVRLEGRSPHHPISSRGRGMPHEEATSAASTSSVAPERIAVTRQRSIVSAAAMLGVRRANPATASSKSRA